MLSSSRNIKAVRDDIPDKTAPIWLHHTVYIMYTCTIEWQIDEIVLDSFNMVYRDEERILD